MVIIWSCKNRLDYHSQILLRVFLKFLAGFSFYPFLPCIHGLVQNCGNSFADALQLSLSNTNPLIQTHVMAASKSSCYPTNNSDLWPCQSHSSPIQQVLWPQTIAAWWVTANIWDIRASQIWWPGASWNYWRQLSEEMKSCCDWMKRSLNENYFHVVGFLHGESTVMWI